MSTLATTATPTQKPNVDPVKMARDSPQTPNSQSLSSSATIKDSPFSDYFANGSQSGYDQSQDNMPSPGARKLLHRLESLGAEILRQDPSHHTAHDLNAKLDDLEVALGAPVAQTRQPAGLADSGLFIDDDEDNEDNHNQHSSIHSHTSPSKKLLDHAPPLTPSINTFADIVPSAIKRKLRAQDRLLKEAQEVLLRVSKANDSLRKRYAEIKLLNDTRVIEHEATLREALALKSENESLKADLGFDHSELLFLKLQLKALEVQSDTMTSSHHSSDPFAENSERILLDDDIARWKTDWDDVDARLRSRRETHRVVSSTPQKLAAARDDGRPKSEDQGSWQLDMCKKRRGRVQSITIKRLDGGVSDDEETLVEDGAGGDGMMTVKARYCEGNTQTEDVLDEEYDGAEKERIRMCDKRTRWKELWDGLHALAGMAKD